MLCDKCHQNEATIGMHINVNGNQKTLNLCQSCYQKERAKFENSWGGMFMNNGFGNFGGFGGFGDFNDLFNQMNVNGFQPNGAKQTVQTQTQGGGNGFLDQFGRNLTAAARAGQIDPVIGRDEEIARVIEILNRRNKNNPVLIGEPGVGKTAIAEGLALKIVEKQVPAKLRNKEVYLLDVASLVANTGIRGQFEERMKKLIAALEQQKNVLIFIDEIHLLVGAGSAEGSMDAGNILKPALARGEIQVIGATTLKEYRQIEKDAALERRFQPVQVNEPGLNETVMILRGLKDRYEKYHHVTYTDEAIEACVNLSHRYIQDRFLPDKAIDLMDEAGSKLNLTITVPSKEDIQKRLAEIAQEKQAALAKEDYEKAAELKKEEEKLQEMAASGQEASKPVVDVVQIQEIVEKKTGIPVGKLEADEAQKLQHLEENLAAKVIGQEEAVKKVAKAIRRSRAGLKAKNRPIGSFLFVGPTGVGKTELTKRLAEQLFGTKDAMIRLDMSEYMEKHSVSKLIGAPAGYVGYEDAGQLTEKVRHNPYSIILLDEIEKAHPDVLNMFLQILDDGRLTDAQGRTVSFKDTVIIMTSNAGTQFKHKEVGFAKSEAIKESNILDSLGEFFKPEFLNRFDSIIEFKSLEKEHLIKIVDLMLGELSEMLKEQAITLEVSEEAKEKIADLGYDPAFGARPIRRVIQEKVEDRIADFILDHPEVKNLKAEVRGGEIAIAAK
ncbi:ATP-dependent Clp protease ATP-binding subunit ClpE [Weizmannia acidilactici]|uniref:ATP-dependent Clp protease ATP-binding subunit ClpE n=1 Tax=Weizmannia acidilactici TaxID=2607726 RepID=A0A5J4JJS1_9BACI|nr:ATP-dependent Clp protease ATP-binding subunit [Weizmannia acidilactici]GER68136.1 ATP-dependent Clp protease ATP-binding subunit ClpE [Weizmannia acidilactici]GER71489.1 ATP-dependent Clp protease ATP-binding subunit ClpE [Weizmannia acidilactici]GER74500.1 ATP-dependent Clp protease ATP-binding subunit ClpE [Weizmannia acidilactici]